MSGIPEPGPLHGIRVVDFGHKIAGPLTAVMLADQGADVVHIDAPGAAAADAPADAFFNRGKRRITLDLKQPGDLATARALIARSDVLIENFRPGVMGRLRLGYAELSAVSPRLVYCSLPGFGATDPRAGLPGWEGVIDAATGNCRIRAGEAPERWDSSRPTYSSVPGASTAAAFLASVAVVSALVERHTSGCGQHIEVPLFDAVFEVIGDAGTYITAQGLSPQLPLAKYGSGTYQCRDGRYVQFNPIGATSRFVSWFLRAAGKPEWALQPDDDAELRGRLTQLFATRTAADWERLGQEAGVPLARIRSAAEWLAAPHAQAAGEVVRLEDPVLGRTWMAGIPVHTAAVPDACGLDRPLSPRHRSDADRGEVLAELAAGGRQASAQADLLPANQAPPAVGARERPMTGLRVLDLTQILAGPSSARLLGELGAEVIKINAPHRKIFAHGVINRGKKSILLDVQHPAGQDVFWRLVADADVIVQNFPPGTAERYGIGYEDVRVRKPDMVYVSVSCYGSAGPWAHGRGYETQGQAVTGIMARAGGDDGKPAVLGPYNFAGVKLRLVGPIMGELGEDIITAAKQAARDHHVPLMVHIGDFTAKTPAAAARSGELTRFLLKTMEPGDILTHLCTPNAGRVLDDAGQPFPEVAEARASGVVLDSALGRGNFGYEVASRQAQLGLHPDTISSDLTAMGQTFHSLLECMAKFMAIGYPLADVVRMTTARPASVLGRADEIGALAVGRDADITILDLVEGNFTFTDTTGQAFRGGYGLVPVHTLRAGLSHSPHWGTHPWGWLPARS